MKSEGVTCFIFILLLTKIEVKQSDHRVIHRSLCVFLLVFSYICLRLFETLFGLPQVLTCVHQRAGRRRARARTEEPAVALRMRGRFLVLLLLGVASGGPRRGSEPSNPPLTIGLILPKTLFGVRGYNKAITEATNGLTKPRGPKLEFLKKYTFTAAQVHNQMMVLTPSPTGIAPLSKS